MHRLAHRLDELYQRTFPQIGAGDEFFSYLDKWEAKVMESLKKRPMSRAEVNALEGKAFQAIRAKLMQVAKAVTQPRMQELVHIETGKTRLIPYVE